MHCLLIANRGEIACRIIRTARLRGLRTVAVYSAVETTAQHVLMADAAVCIGGREPGAGYLDIDRIIAAAKSSGADAIHPGYGFLSENPGLVEACEAAGIVFVGPGAAAIRAMGLKDAAKRCMSEAGVPVVPGYHGESQDSDVLEAEALAIGYPVLVKARAGGGGKGMRRVDSPDDVGSALAAARREAEASFGDANVLIEKYIQSPRHIEVQVFGDSHGNVVHLFERDCTLQRRHQKVVEEAPAPGMSAAVRQAMTDAAVRAARAIDYRGAGTVEFIVDGSRELRPDGFWFMEMNTRLQVEHPVTEAITGIDLVDWQLRVAAGEPLPLRQEQIHLQGHAVEARLYAENPANGFLPSTGRLSRLRLASSGRVDSGVVEGDEVLPHFDPLLAKMIVHAQERTAAFAELSRQLAASVVLGVSTNREFLARLLDHPQVLQGRFDTSFIESRLAELLTPEIQQHLLLAVAAVEIAAPVGVSGWCATFGQTSGETRCETPNQTLAQTLGPWRLWEAAQYTVRLVVNGELRTLEVCASDHRQGRRGAGRDWCVSARDFPGFPAGGIQIRQLDGSRISVDGCEYPLQRAFANGFPGIQVGPWSLQFALPDPASTGQAGPVEDTILSPMPGRVVAINCQTGESVKAGRPLIVVEAMKMEQSLSAGRDGVVDSIPVRVGSQVTQGQELLRLTGLILTG